MPLIRFSVRGRDKSLYRLKFSLLIGLPCLSLIDVFSDDIRDNMGY